MNDDITALGCTNEKLADFLIEGRVIAFNHISPLDNVKETDVTLVSNVPVGRTILSIYTSCFT